MDNVTRLKNVYEAFGRGEMPAVLAAMSPDIRWHQAEGNPYNPSGEAWVGPDAVLNNLFVRIGGDWDGFTVNPKTYHDAGDSVVVEGRYRGTFKATGKSMDIQFCHVWHIRDGKAIKFQQYLDTAKVQDAMGVR